MKENASPIACEINVTTLPQNGRQVEILADADQRLALAEAHDLLAVDRFEAVIDVRRWQRDGVRVTGTITTDLAQRCVVSLEPVPAAIRTGFEATFLPDDSPLSRRHDSGAGGDLIIDAEGPDAPEPFEPPMLDVGAVAEEFFELALNPYPRAPEVEPLDTPSDDTEETAPKPFAALETLRGKV